MATVPVLGTYLPREMNNDIAKYLLEQDRTAVILPHQIYAAGVAPAQNQNGGTAAETLVTSKCALFRITKEARALYTPMFKQKFLDLDVDRIIVEIEDFDITAFWSIWEELMMYHRPHVNPIRTFPYEFRLSFTEKFLRNPDSKNLVEFANLWSGMWPTRFMYITYTIEPIPIVYVDKLLAILNEQFFARVDLMDPEFDHVLAVFKQLYESGEIVRPEDRGKKIVGHWVKGEYVVKEAHEWRGDEWKNNELSEEEQEPIVWYN